jgi:hypothetical protein
MTSVVIHKAQAVTAPEQTKRTAAATPPTITGDNIYVAWWTNKTGNDEVMFRESTNAGKTFGNKINLSNTTDADSTRVEIDSDADSVVVTWRETNGTSDIPVMSISDDNGKTFGETINLSTNGPIG